MSALCLSAEGAAVARPGRQAGKGREAKMRPEGPAHGETIIVYHAVNSCKVQSKLPHSKDAFGAML